MNRMRFAVTARTPITNRSFASKITLSHFLATSKTKSFWDFLNLDFLKKLELLCYRFLLKRESICFEEEVIKSVEYIEIDVDKDILETCREHINNYYNVTGKTPQFIFIGRREYNQLVEVCLHHQYLARFPSLYYETRLERETFVRNVLCGVKIVISPYLEGVFIWGGEDCDR